MTSRRSRRILLLLLLAALTIVSAGGCGALKRRREEKAKALPAGEELFAKASVELERRHLSKAKTLLAGIQFTAENRAALEPQVRLALADVLFYTGDSISLIDARSKYVEFVTLYGDNRRAAYAQFQTGICALKQISKAGRDQGQTRAAISDFEDVEKRYAASPYAAAARAEVDIANAVLAEHEFRVGRFYMKRKAYFAAAERFRSVLEKYPRFGEKQKVYLELGRALILAKNGVEGSIYLDKLVNDYPGDARAAEARKLLAGLASAARGGAKEGEPKPR